jgi:dipeptidase E
MAIQQLILAGGGDPKDSMLVDRFYNMLLPRKRLLFLPQAVAPVTWSYDRAYFWLRRNPMLKNIKIRMWKHLTGKSYDDLAVFDTVYVMGGNTFKLLYQLRKTGFLEHLSRFIKSGRVVYGISAGAIILGKDIQTALIGTEADKNEVGLRNLEGLNLLNGYNVHPHYDPANDESLFDHLRKNKSTSLLAIPEKSGAYVRNNSLLVLGYDPIYLFQDGKKKSFRPGKRVRLLNIH